MLAIMQDVKKLKMNGRLLARAQVPWDAVDGAVGVHAVCGGRSYLAFISGSLAPTQLSMVNGLLSDVCRLNGWRRPSTPN